MQHFKTRLLATLAACALSTAALATDVTGAGSSFVYPIMSKWSATYAGKTGHHVNYQSIGSGGGIAQIKAGTVDFAASDKPLDAATLGEHGLTQFPIVIGGIVPVVHVAGIEPGELVLDGATLAGIYLGEIENWNDPAIAALNPGLTLPDERIIVVHRSDGSGTSYNFTDYLAKVSPAWKNGVGRGAAVNWPTGIGGKGNEGVTAYVRQFDNSIGYVEYAYALQNKLAWTKMTNAAGQAVAPTQVSFAAAATSADWSKTRHFNLLMTNAPGAKAWPITATTWVLLPEGANGSERGKVALDFITWALDHGDAAATKLHYVPLPDALVKQVKAYWKAGAH